MTSTEFLAVLAIAIFLAVATSVLTAMKQADKKVIDRNQNRIDEEIQVDTTIHSASSEQNE